MVESPVLDEVKDLIQARTSRENVTTFFVARFGSVPADVRASLAGIADPGRLDALVRLAATCPNLATFAASIGPES